MKRHTRPYFCTFPDCSQAFGSKHDWARHERARHIWRELRVRVCKVDGCPDLENPVPFDHFSRNHRIEKDHEGVDGNDQKELWEIRTKEGPVRFWCGFCARLVDCRQKNDPIAWGARSRHIGDHVEKEQREKKDWLPVQGVLWE